MEIVVDNGVVIEPSLKDKIVAKVKRDKQAFITLPFGDVQQMVADQLWSVGCSDWMKKYKTMTMQYNESDNTFTITLNEAKS